MERFTSTTETGSFTAVEIVTAPGIIAFEFSEPLIRLIQSLRTASNYAIAAQALGRAESELDDWEMEVRLDDAEGVVLPFGIRVRLQGEFGRPY